MSRRVRDPKVEDLGNTAPWEVRVDDDGALDEIVGKGAGVFVHLERMNHDHVWIGLDLDGGKDLLMVNLWAEIPPGRKRPVLRMRVERG